MNINGNIQKMKKQFLFLIVFLSALGSFAQSRPANKLTVEKTYFMSAISPALRGAVDRFDKESYFNDAFFNNMLKKIVLDIRYNEKEKAQIFYLMLKKVGYSFVGVDYLPPKQTYFSHHSGKMYIFQETKKALKELHYDIKGLIQVVDSNLKKDAIVAGCALLLADLLNSEVAIKKLEKYTQGSLILGAKNPDIFNHYVCMCTSIAQNTVISSNLTKNLYSFKNECMLEDVFCAIYSRDNYVSLMKDYILAEKNPKNELVIQTALCALASKVPIASYNKSVGTLVNEAKEPWKVELCKKMLNGEIPFRYALSSRDQLVTKLWEGVTETEYADGLMIINGTVMEFDPY